MVYTLSSVKPLLLALCASITLPSLIDAHVVRHQFTITWEVGAPNGIAREMIKINGGFPGPNIIANEGDDVEVTSYQTSIVYAKFKNNLLSILCGYIGYRYQQDAFQYNHTLAWN